MKTRAGFVSNSSSSSFCIVGVTIESSKFDFDRSRLREIVKKCYDYDEDRINGMDDGELLGKVANECGERKICPDFAEEFHIRRYISDEYEHVAGMYIERMDLNETLLQFKTRVLNELKKIGFQGTVDNIEIITDGGRDG